MRELPKYGAGVRGLFRFDKVTGQCVPCAEPPKIPVDAPFVVTDEIPATMSMVSYDAPSFTSKRKLRDHYRENGFIERDGQAYDTRPPPPPKIAGESVRETAARALNDIKYGQAPSTEEERERWKEEQRQYEAWRRRQRAGLKVAR